MRKSDFPPEAGIAGMTFAARFEPLRSAESSGWQAIRVTPYNIPEVCVDAYYPEANALLPVWHYAEGSKTPAAKSIPVMIKRAAAPFTTGTMRYQNAPWR
jgi:hypothetical protein